MQKCMWYIFKVCNRRRSTVCLTPLSADHYHTASCWWYLLASYASVVFCRNSQSHRWDLYIKSQIGHRVKGTNTKPSVCSSLCGQDLPTGCFHWRRGVGLSEKFCRWILVLVANNISVINAIGLYILLQ